MRGILSFIPVLGLMAVLTVAVLLAAAPKTASAHWETQRSVRGSASPDDFGVVRVHGHFNLLWTDDSQSQIIFSAPRDGHWHSTVLFRGQVGNPTLGVFHGQEVGAWVARKGGENRLMVAQISPHPRVYTLLRDNAQMEHPYLFAGPGGRPSLVFSWQRYGNFDIFLLELQRNGRISAGPYRLTHAAIYSFYPRAVTDQYGHIHLFEYEYCCHSSAWNLTSSIFSPTGHRLGRPRLLAYQEGALRYDSAPNQWGLDAVARGGAVWLAYSGEAGAYVLKMAPGGKVIAGPSLVDSASGAPQALSLAVTGRRGWLAWIQTESLGTYPEVRPFDLTTLKPDSADRVTYESADADEPHIVASGSKLFIAWQAVGSGSASHFQWASYHHHIQPTLADRLGLGLGNGWEQMAILVVAALGAAALGTVANIIVLFALIAAGLLVTWLLSRTRGDAVLLPLFFAAALVLVFVKPGGPTLMLTTLPAAGIALMPTGVVVILAIAAILLWLSVVMLRHVEQAFRTAVLASAGVYLFAFAEALVLVQQGLGRI